MTPVRRAVSGPRRIEPAGCGLPLHDVAASRALEAQSLSLSPPHALMQQAGRATARLALALCPHLQRVWVAAGPGNNGGDGLVAALALHQQGVQVWVTLVAEPARYGPDAKHAFAQAQSAGVPMDAAPCPFEPNLAIDALLGMGAARPAEGAMQQAMVALNACPMVLAVDLPSGLNADTGSIAGDVAVHATHTLSLLTLKPGLFTAQGRDRAGQIWFDALGCDHFVAETTPPALRLCGVQDVHQAMPIRPHASHKGRFGDVTILGGAAGMVGAALLAAKAASAAGAGRTYLALLDSSAIGVEMSCPELMLRPQWSQQVPEALLRTTVVCGCGGGEAVAQALPALLSGCARLILDADALNAVAKSTPLRAALRERASRQQLTVLTPHPLEAARLLGSEVGQVQADRLAAARALSALFDCVVALKGSGTIVAAPSGQVFVNPTGNGLLAIGGTGDILAGWLGGLWAQQPTAGLAAAWGIAACCANAAVWLHGLAADRLLAAEPGALPPSPSALIGQLRSAAAAMRGV